MYKKGILFLTLFFGLLFFFPVSIKAEELSLSDKGNGFYLPASFDLKAKDGSFLKAPKIDPALFAAEDPGEEEELELENGLVARKWWKMAHDGSGKAFPCISVYNDEGDEVYRVGRDACENLTVFMEDSEGNTLLSRYTKYEVKYEDGKQQGYSTDLSEPRDMEQYYAEDRVTHYESYTPLSDNLGGSSMMINSHDTYWDEGGAVKNNQSSIDGEVVSTWDEADAIVFDDFEYTIKEPISLTKQEWKMLEPCFTEGDTHICPSYTSALAGQPVTGVKVIMRNDAGEEIESIMLFTDTHLDIMEDENVLIHRHVEYKDGTSGTEPVIYYDVIKKQCPLYLYDEMFACTELIECRSKKAEEMFRKQEEIEQKKRDAIIRGSERQAASEEAEEGNNAGQDGTSGTYSERDGEPVWTQKIVGDVVPIDGMIPETLETWEHDGHVLLTLRDASGNIVHSADNGTDKSHTGYEYVYFTQVSLLDNGYVVFQIAGTDDAGMGGNLNRISSGITDTDQGSTGVTDYYYD